MEPVLIRTDTKTINEQKENLNRAVTYAQSIYNQFKAINVPLTLEQIADVVFWAKNGYKEEIRKMVVDHIIDSKGIENFFGVPVNRKKIEEIIDTPDLTDIIKWINNNPFAGVNNTDFGIFRGRINLLTIENDLVKKVAGADTTIEEQHTHYTKNNKGAELATKLLEIIETFNDYAAYINDKESNGVNKNLIYEDKFKGLVYNGGTYQLDLDFIRRMEA